MTMVPDYNTSSHIVASPAEVDVLCGKTSTSRHPGNVFFRELILSKVGEYMLSVKKAQKGLIVANILKELVKNGARFMKKDKQSQQWSIISPADAREKVSHAIRDRVRERKKGKIIMPDLPVLASPPTLSTITPRETSSKTCKKTSAKAFSKMKTYRKKSLKHIEVVQGGEDILTLRAALYSHNRVVSEDEESAATADESYVSYLPPSYLKNNHQERYLNFADITPAPIFSCLGPYDLLPEDAEQLSSLLGDNDDAQDDSSVFLDDYNDLMVSDIPSGQEYSDFVVSMLQEACSLMLEEWDLAGPIYTIFVYDTQYFVTSFWHLLSSWKRVPRTLSP